MGTVDRLQNPTLPFIAGLLIACAPVALLAAPQDGVVAAGQAVIHSAPGAVHINQTSARAVIDWRKFDVAPGESVTFNQPGRHAFALNRVNDVDPSHINGKITANGHIAIVNPNGVVFGAGAQVDAAGLIASTADIDNARFMQGDLRFDKPGNPDAAVENHGCITAREAGLVGLVAPSVRNSGTIVAQLGKVQLASGSRFTVDLAGDGLINLVMDGVPSQPQQVTNSGAIIADGGTIVLSAAQAGAAVDRLIENSGTLRAQTVSQSRGEIRLEAGGSTPAHTSDGHGHIVQSGVIDVQGKASGEQGGKVRLFADEVQVTSGTVTAASKRARGGDIQIGGDYLGSGASPRATHAVVHQDAAINASGGKKGGGGRVILWSDGHSQMNGHILARGGALGGHGGFVETSGKETLGVLGTVDVSAPAGKGGA